MRGMWSVLPFVMVLLLGCPPPAQDTAADTAAIDAFRDEFVAAFNLGDIPTMEGMLSDDCIAMPPNETVLMGTAAIRSWWEDLFAQFTSELTLGAAEVEVAGDWAFERGSYSRIDTPIEEGDPVEDHGKYIWIYERVSEAPEGEEAAGERWLIARAIWNSDLPPAAAPMDS